MQPRFCKQTSALCEHRSRQGKARCCTIELALDVALHCSSAADTTSAFFFAFGVGVAAAF